MNELLALLIGFLLTLFIYSYLFGDNPLYRLAVSLLVGVTAGYASVIALQEVLLPVLVQIQQEPTEPAALAWLIPLFLGLLLFFKLAQRTAPLGNVTVAAIIGIGSAVALVGVISGTLWPQITATPNGGGLLGLLTALLTICTVLYFQFTGRRDRQGEVHRPAWLRPVAGIGRAVLTITFGALFAGLLSTSLVLLADRLSFFVNQFLLIFDAFLS